MTTKFFELPVGAHFEFRGRRYEKLALSLAWDEERSGNVFHAETEVVREGAPQPAEMPQAGLERARTFQKVQSQDFMAPRSRL